MKNMWIFLFFFLMQLFYAQEFTEETPTAIFRERIENLNKKTPVELDYNSTVQAFIDRQLRMSNYMGDLISRATFYFPLFEEKLAKYNIPVEIKYLAIVESSLKATAGSRAGAKGLWQFMHGTGKMFNLNVNNYVDERYDPILATEAACHYLSELYNTYNNWPLALAAYNAGPGNINKAIKRAGGIYNFWSIRPYLSRETQNYVPSFIAVTYMMNHYTDHDINPQHAPYNYFDTDTVHVQFEIHFNRLSQALNLSRDEIEFLNPAYKRSLIPGSIYKGYTLRLPKDKIPMFKQKKFLLRGVKNPSNNDTPVESTKNQNTDLVLLPSEKLVKLEKTIFNPSFEKSSSDIDQINKTPDYKDVPSEMEPKITLEKTENNPVINASPLNITDKKSNNKVVSKDETILAKKQNIKPPSSQNTNQNRKKSKTFLNIHIVKEGETLSQIAKKHDIAITDIKKWNNLPGKKIIANTSLNLSLPKQKGKVKEKQSTVLKKRHLLPLGEYTFRSGDNLYRIAKQYPGISAEDIAKENQIDIRKVHLIKPGTQIKINHLKVKK